MNLRSLFAVAAVAAATLPAHAATVVGWTFENAVAPSNGTTWTGIVAESGTVAGTASIVHTATSAYSTPAGNGSPKSISSTAWTIGDYYQFAFSTTGLSSLSLSFDQAGSGTGPASFLAEYSVDGGSTFTTLGAYTVVLSTWSNSTVMSGFTQTYTLGSALNNQASVLVRLMDNATSSINGGTVASTGTDRVDNFVVSTAPVPEPETYALMAAGLGIVGFMARRRKV